MSANSKIEWTGDTWNPIRALAPGAHGRPRIGWHCEHVSEGCRNCYAERQNRAIFGNGLAYKPGHRADIELFLDEKMLLAPLRRRSPRKIFVCSMTDLFADFVPDEMIDRIFAVMALCPQHTFQVLTKRPERMRAYLSDPRQPMRRAEAVRAINRDGRPGKKGCTPDAIFAPAALPNVWLGTSVEDQIAANTRIPDLLETPAAKRFLSCEPLLGPVDLKDIRFRNERGALEDWDALDLHLDDGEVASGCSATIDWVIVGGESGKGARPMHPDWARALRDQCAAASVPFFFKQWGAWLPAGQIATQTGLWNPSCDRALLTTKKNAGRSLDGVTHDGMPS